MVVSMNQLWGTINALQIMVYMPLFWLKFPANAAGLNYHLIDIANFEALPTEDMNEEVFVLPPADPFNVRF